MYPPILDSILWVCSRRWTRSPKNMARQCKKKPCDCLGKTFRIFLFFSFFLLTFNNCIHLVFPPSLSTIIFIFSFFLPFFSLSTIVFFSSFLFLHSHSTAFTFYHQDTSRHSLSNSRHVHSRNLQMLSHCLRRCTRQVIRRFFACNVLSTTLSDAHGNKEQRVTRSLSRQVLQMQCTKQTIGTAQQCLIFLCAPILCFVIAWPYAVARLFDCSTAQRMFPHQRRRCFQYSNARRNTLPHGRGDNGTATRHKCDGCASSSTLFFFRFKRGFPTTSSPCIRHDNVETTQLSLCSAGLSYGRLCLACTRVASGLSVAKDGFSIVESDDRIHFRKP